MEPTDAPLPHLVGPAPVPRDIKRAHAALWLSVSGWTVLVVSFAALIGIISVTMTENGNVPWFSNQQSVPAMVTGRVITGSGVALCFFGMVLGFGSWKHRRGKTAALLGAANVATAAIVAFAAFWTNRR